MSDTDSADQGLIHEVYKQASEGHGFYADMRFKQLTLFGVLSGLLINALNSQTFRSSAPIIGLIGIASTSLLWIMEIRSSIHAQTAREIKRSFEKLLLHPSREFDSRWILVNATNAIPAFYLAALLSWSALFLTGSRHGLLYGLALLPLPILLIVFTLREYAPLLVHGWKHWHW
jgi:hypothetical protein